MSKGRQKKEVSSSQVFDVFALQHPLIGFEDVEKI